MSDDDKNGDRFIWDESQVAVTPPAKTQPHLGAAPPEPDKP